MLALRHPNDEAIKILSHGNLALPLSSPARYRLLFSDTDIDSVGGSLQAAALDAFAAFVTLVQ